MLWKILLAFLALWATALAYPAGADDFGVPTNEAGYDKATFGALDLATTTASRYKSIKIGCHRNEGICKTKKQLLDTTLPEPTHYCTREALAALAIWRMFCKKSISAYCWERAPSIERCCSQWVDKDDPKWKDYPALMEQKNGKWVPTESSIDDQRKIIRPSSKEFNPNVGGKWYGCGYWKPQTSDEYTWVINHLEDYGIKDVDETGKIIGEEKWNAEEGGK
ncbi:hypothetical protein PV05_01962 [Exophiala xenobiotica]|uniref:Secreted protein n=1 Tax=Exophiala xenobiotica TaxID=348802 RepID=A0A0D2CA80_9EURO|nr:uncharacterized protein PV05_01962 [Exophiala xenobiotica]KIW61891.1 hypothetical protein PV05_01962 [Exophiala xenobiotica]